MQNKTIHTSILKHLCNINQKKDKMVINQESYIYINFKMQNSKLKSTFKQIIVLF